MTDVKLILAAIEDEIIFATAFTGWRGFRFLRASQEDVDRIYTLIVKYGADHVWFSLTPPDRERLREKMQELEDYYIRRIWIARGVKQKGISLASRPWWHRWLSRGN